MARNSRTAAVSATAASTIATANAFLVSALMFWIILVTLLSVPLLAFVGTTVHGFPVGERGNGTCGPTSVGGDCNVDFQGSFPAAANGIKTLADCVARVGKCAQGNYASFSAGWDDCSWYASCDFTALCADCTQPGPLCPGGSGTTGHCPTFHPFQSQVVKATPAGGGGSKAPIVGQVGNGTCGPTNYGGDCNTDYAGAWDAKANGITSLADCVKKAQGCLNAHYVSFSAGFNDCSFYAACDFSQLCEDCSQAGPQCPGGAGTGGHCPSYRPYQSQVLVAGPPSPSPPSPGPTPPPTPPPPPSPTPTPTPPVVKADVTMTWAASASFPVGMTGNGTCGTTNYGGNCSSDTRGAFNAGQLGITSLAECVSYVQKQGCAMANFVSYSTKNSDCSWYQSCDMNNLCTTCSQPYAPYESEVLKKVPAQFPVTAATAATVEVDVMPFLSRNTEGGPFDAYYEALRNLGAEFVRFSPWFPYPRVAVTELDPPDCTPTKPATNWNSTEFDAIMRDFMAAVCGERAEEGICIHSVAQQLSTMPAWLYTGAYPVPGIPEDPWEYANFGGYNRGSALVNETCNDMAAYVARIVSHYTRGGHHDSCGHWHGNGFTYNWTILSVLNENERNIGGPRYTRCFDAIRRAVESVNKKVKLAGPELVFDYPPYTKTFLDPTTHDDGRAPDILSNHAYLGQQGGGTAGQAFFGAVDGLITGLEPIVAERNRIAPKTEMVLNEFIPFNSDWCDPEDAEALFAQHGGSGDGDLKPDPRSAACPNWQDPRSNMTRINRKTLGWNAAAATFAYGYGRLGLLGYKYVGADQLIGGPWPDNEPAVSCLDWKTGQPNAKYYAITMLASTLGSGQKSFFGASYNVSGAPVSNQASPIFALPYIIKTSGARGVLLVNKRAAPVSVTMHAPSDVMLENASAQVLDGTLDGLNEEVEPGFMPPMRRLVNGNGTIILGAYGMALVDAGNV